MNSISDICNRYLYQKKIKESFFIYKKLYFKGEVLCVCMFSVCDSS